MLVAFLQRRLQNPLMEVALAKHAAAARDEVQQLADEFLELVAQTSVPTPAIELLYPYLAENAPLLPEGSKDIPLDWRSTWIALAAVGGALAGAALLNGLVGGRRDE